MSGRTREVPFRAMDEQGPGRIGFAVCIPCAGSHVDDLIDLLRSIRLPRELVTGVSVSISGVPPWRRRSLTRRIRAISLDRDLPAVVLSWRWWNLTAGENRNRAWRRAHGTFTCFLDADDRYADDRFEVIAEVAARARSRPDLILHTFGESLTWTSAPPDAARAPRLVMGTQLRSVTLHPANRAGTVRVPRGQQTSRPIHHGHITVRTAWRDRMSFRVLLGAGDDTAFIRDVMTGGGSLVVIDAPLSEYRIALTAHRPKSTADRVFVRFRELVDRAFHRLKETRG